MSPLVVTFDLSPSGLCDFLWDPPQHLDPLPFIPYPSSSADWALCYLGGRGGGVTLGGAIGTPNFWGMGTIRTLILGEGCISSPSLKDPPQL